MSEVLRPQVKTSAEQRPQGREQIAFNMAEIAVLSLVNPVEAFKSLESKVVTLAIEPDLEIRNLEDGHRISLST